MFSCHIAYQRVGDPFFAHIVAGNFFELQNVMWFTIEKIALKFA
jgi:hypothetical protein